MKVNAKMRTEELNSMQWKASGSCGVKPDDEKWGHRQTDKYAIVSKPAGESS